MPEKNLELEPAKLRLEALTQVSKERENRNGCHSKVSENDTNLFPYQRRVTLSVFT